MIEKKLGQLQRLMSGLDQEKLQNNEKIDSITLISENLSRGRQPYNIAKPNIVQTIQKQSSLTQTYNVPSSFSKITPKLTTKSKSMKDPSIPGSPLKASKSQISNEFNMRKLTLIA